MAHAKTQEAVEQLADSEITRDWWIGILEEVERFGLAHGHRDEKYMIRVSEALKRLRGQ